MILSAETLLGLRMTGTFFKCIIQHCISLCITHSLSAAKAFIGLVQYLFSLPIVKDNHLAFLSQRLCQDPLENFFGCQRQRGGTRDNPNVQEFFKNIAALRVVNSFCRKTVKGNCRGAEDYSSTETNSACAPLPKRPRRK